MTGALVARIWIFVVAAFGLGLLVGWMFWRFHRSSIPSDRWQAEQADLQAQRRRADQLAADRDAPHRARHSRPLGGVPAGRAADRRVGGP